jgi:hypothetical protein
LAETGAARRPCAERRRPRRHGLPVAQPASAAEAALLAILTATSAARDPDAAAIAVTHATDTQSAPDRLCNNPARRARARRPPNRATPSAIATGPLRTLATK